MQRLKAIILESFVYGFAVPIALWAFMGSVLSFVTWQNAFNDWDSLGTLRAMFLIGVCVAAWRTHHLIKNNKI